MELQENLNLLANNKISLGLNLIEKLNEIKHIPGVQKIQRKIGQEIKFLEKNKSSKTLTTNHVMCSNLIHYEFLVLVLTKQTDLVHVDCAFKIDNKQNPIRVDVVCENGAKWIKVIARNSKSISDAAKGNVSFGVKSIVDQADEYSRTAEQNLYMFKKPQIIFYFSHIIDSELLNEIQNYGIFTIIDNKDVPLLSTKESTWINSNNDIQLDNKILNLDITTLLAYISALTNGHCKLKFKEPLLTEQAIREQKAPLKPLLDSLFKEKQLICCHTAKESFKSIVDLLGGPEEQQRAEILMNSIVTIPDLDEIPQNLRNLEVCGKIKPRSLKIFAFGLANKAITVTSNEGFIRSAKMKGINFPVYIHQARALTELKENEADVII